MVILLFHTGRGPVKQEFDVYHSHTASYIYILFQTQMQKKENDSDGDALSPTPHFRAFVHNSNSHEPIRDNAQSDLALIERAVVVVIGS